MVGWIKMKLGMEVGLGPGHIVVDGDTATAAPKGAQPPIFGPCLLWSLLLSFCSVFQYYVEQDQFLAASDSKLSLRWRFVCTL